MRYSIVSACSVLLFALSQSWAACADGDEPVENSITCLPSLFDEGIVGDTNELACLGSPPRSYPSIANYDYPTWYASYFSAINAQEWAGFFKGPMNMAEWRWVLYDAPIAYIDSLIFFLKGKYPAPSGRISRETLKACGPDQLVRALYYLGFAKRVEPIATEGTASRQWRTDGLPARQSFDSTVQKMIDGGTRMYVAEKERFLKRRYAFQVLRLYFYKGDFSGCCAWYDSIGSILDKSESIYWRSLGYCAGSWYRTGRYAEANYRYSLIFDGYPPMRAIAAFNFHPQEQSDWEECLGLATKKRERLVLWQLYGLFGDGMTALRKMYAVDPASDLLPLVLVSQVRSAECAKSDGHENRRIAAKLNELFKFCDRAVKNGKMSRKHVWFYTLGHLYFARNELTNATKYFMMAEQSCPPDSGLKKIIGLYYGYYQDSIALVPTIARVRALKKIDKSVEAELVNALAASEKANPSPKFRQQVYDAVKERYLQGGDTLMGTLFAGQPLFEYDSPWTERCLAFLDKKDKSPLLSFLAGGICDIKKSLLEFRAISQIRAGKYGDAEKTLRTAYGNGEKSPLFEVLLRNDKNKQQLRAGFLSHRDTLKAKLLLEQWQITPDTAWTDRLIAFCDRTRKDQFEQYLMQRQTGLKEAIARRRALPLILNFSFNSATRYLRLLPKERLEPLPGDPFMIHIKDCHDCDHHDPKKKTYTTVSFIERMAELAKTAKGQKDAAQRWFEYANGLYNITYYGNTRIGYLGLGGDGQSTADCSKAEEFYLMAMDASQDREFRAKACFMAAKCEQNRWYENPAVPQPRTRFNILRRDFQETKYYQEIIRECGYFNEYVAKAEKMRPDAPVPEPAGRDQ